MSEQKSPAAYRGPGGIGRWVWWYVIVMLLGMAAFAAFTAF
jgi:hypothetical protein